MAPIERDRGLSLRVSAEERDMLARLADADGLSSSDLIRQFIRRSYRERFGDAPATAKPRRGARRA